MFVSSTIKWLRGLNHKLLSDAGILGSLVRIPLEKWMPIYIALITKYYNYVLSVIACFSITIIFSTHLFNIIYSTSLFPRRCPGIYLSQSYIHMCTKFGWNRSPRRYVLNKNFYAPWLPLFPRCCPGIYLSQSYSHMCTKLDSNRAPRRNILNNNFYAPWRYITHTSADLDTVTSSH
jgi:hypothetical protein